MTSLPREFVTSSAEMELLAMPSNDVQTKLLQDTEKRLRTLIQVCCTQFRETETAFPSRGSFWAPFGHRTR